MQKNEVILRHYLFTDSTKINRPGHNIRVVVFWKCLLLPTFCALTCALRTVLFSWEREGVVGGWATEFLEVFAAAVTP